MNTKKYYTVTRNLTIVTTPITTISKKEFNTAAKVLGVSDDTNIMESIIDFVVNGFTENVVRYAPVEYGKNQMILIHGDGYEHKIVAMIFDNKFYILSNQNKDVYSPEIHSIFKMRKYTHMSYVAS